MKKNISLHKLLTIMALVCLLLVSLAGCKEKAASNDPSGETVSGDTVQTDPSATEDATQTTPPVATEPEETEPMALMGTVTADNLNVRSNPSTDSTVLNQLDLNARVVIIEQKVVGDITWGRIAEGWINMNYILLDGDDPAPPTEPEAGDGDATAVTGTISASELNIRKENNTDADVVGKYKKGDKVEILEVKDGWGRTDKGWISMKYVNTTGAEETPEISDEKDKEEDKEASTLVTDGKTTVLGYVIVDAEALNVRYGPGTKYNVSAKVYEGDKLAYYQEKNGWVRVQKGWISLAYTDKENDEKKESMVSDKNTKVLGYAIVTTNSLNARTGPGTDYESIDKFDVGAREAFYQKDGKWIRTEDGWISTDYTYIEGEKGTGAGSGTVTGDSVNIRTGPGTGFKSAGKVNTGDKVEILAQVKIGKTTWGYTSKGWISMEFVKMN